MKALGLARGAVISVVCAALSPPVALGLDPEQRPAAAVRGVLTNEGLVELAEAGYDEDFLIDLMNLKPLRFDTSVEGLAFLARKGVSESIVRAVLAHAQDPPHGSVVPALPMAMPMAVSLKCGWFFRTHCWVTSLALAAPPPAGVSTPALKHPPALATLQVVPITTHPVTGAPQPR